MSTKQTIDSLWQEFRDAVNDTYAHALYLTTHGTTSDNRTALRDYSQNVTWNDSLSALLGREVANERRHRSNRPSVAGFSNETAAKLILMNNVTGGASKNAMPPASDFLIYRQTAVEAQVIGFLARDFLSQDWRYAVKALDYAKLMQGKQ